MLNASMGLGSLAALLPFADRWARGARFGKIPSVGRGGRPSLQDKEVRYRLAVARGMIPSNAWSNWYYIRPASIPLP
jgi:hypothetical protein